MLAGLPDRRRRCRAAALVVAAFGILAAVGPAHGGQVLSIDIKGVCEEQPATPSGLGTSYRPCPVINVMSVDGKTYNHVVSQGLAFELWLKSACSPNSLDSKVDLSIGTWSATVVQGWGGSLFDGLVGGKNLSFETPWIPPQAPWTPVQACNNRVAELEAAGTPVWQAVKSGFALKVNGAYSPTLKVTCGAVIKNSSQKSVQVPAWIHCLPSSLAEEPRPETPRRPPQPGPQVFAVPFQVTDATVSVSPAQGTGPCPRQLEVTASLTAVGAGTAEIRIGHKGGLGPVIKVPFAQGGKKTSTANYEIGKKADGPGGTEAAPGGGGGGIGGLQQSTSPNQHTGYFEVQVVAPNTLKSNQAFYTAHCVQTAVATGPQVLAPQPTAGLKRSDEACYSVTCQATGPSTPGVLVAP